MKSFSDPSLKHVTIPTIILCINSAGAVDFFIAPPHSLKKALQTGWCFFLFSPGSLSLSPLSLIVHFGQYAYLQLYDASKGVPTAGHQVSHFSRKA